MSLNYPKTSIYRWSSANEANRWDVENPATGEVITSVQSGDSDTVEKAVQASQTAFEKRWRPLSPQVRSDYLLQCANALERHKDELATLLCAENGKPKADAMIFDIGFLVGIFRYYGGLCGKLPSEFYDRGPLYSTVFYEPHGVCCGIIPFNWPPIHTGGKMAPALAAGNTMILKPGEQAPLTTIRIVEICQTVLPEDVVQFVPGLGVEVPQALIKHPLMKMVSFTGSTAAGKSVAKLAAESVTPVVLELGGKNALIVFEDADLDLAVRGALEGAFFNKGEACTAASRLLIHANVYDKFVERLGAGVKRLVVGDGFDPNTHVGPQVSRAHQQRILDYIELTKQEGAHIAAQASLPSDPRCKNGFFVPPTLVTNVSRDMRIAKEEMFGSIVTATPFSTFEEAISIANESDFALTAVVYSQNALLVNRAVRALDAGMIWSNNYFRAVLGTPFGGNKSSGYGREHSIDTLKEWCVKKAVHQPSGLSDVPEWKVVKDIYGQSGSEVHLN